jgi:hypothetical protein
MYCPERTRHGALIVLALALFGCGGGGGDSSTVDNCSTSPAVVGASQAAGNPNELRVTVNSGISIISNRLYADVTICRPGTSTCGTISNVLVDTGSTGLRILSSAIPSAVGTLPSGSTTANPLLACQQFLDNTFVWGSVRLAKVVLGNEAADSQPIQVIGDTAGASALNCHTGTNLSSASLLGANGILGIGTTKEDCGSACNTGNHGYYYTCPTGACSGGVTATTVPKANQIQNPVMNFAVNGSATDNNGVMVSLPSVGSCGATSVTGSILFGVGTRSNNQLGSATLLQATSRSAHINTNASSSTLGYSSGTMSNSFLDTGSNGLFFGTASTVPMSTCTSGNWYCPASPTSFSATLAGANGASKSVVFIVRSSSNLFSTNNFALPSLAGPSNDLSLFDWGLPFFYGRNVFIGFEDPTSSLGYYAGYYAF